jgi:hypothetical protein
MSTNLTVGKKSPAAFEVAGSDKISHLIHEIATASKERPMGVEQINTAVTEMDQVTQGNASAAEESASAAEELKAQSEVMHVTVQELVKMIGGTVVASSNQHGQPRSVTRPRPALAAVRQKIGTVKHVTEDAGKEFVDFPASF